MLCRVDLRELVGTVLFKKGAYLCGVTGAGLLGKDGSYVLQLQL